MQDDFLNGGFVKFIDISIFLFIPIVAFAQLKTR